MGKESIGASPRKICPCLEPGSKACGGAALHPIPRPPCPPCPRARRPAWPARRDRKGRAVLTLLGWSTGSGSSRSGTKMTSSRFLARRRPLSRPMVALGAPLPPPAGRQGPSLLTTLAQSRKTSATLLGFQESSLVLGAEKEASDSSCVHKSLGSLPPGLGGIGEHRFTPSSKGPGEEADWKHSGLPLRLIRSRETSLWGSAESPPNQSKAPLCCWW